MVPVVSGIFSGPRLLLLLSYWNFRLPSASVWVNVE